MKARPRTGPAADGAGLEFLKEEKDLVVNQALPSSCKDAAGDVT